MEAASRSRIFMVFAGQATPADAPYEARLRGLVAQSGLSQIVRFLGFRTDIPNLFAAADVVLHCSTQPEPAGTVVLEAMALGRTVVASNIGGPVEFLPKGVGILHDASRPSDLAAVLTQLSGDSMRREELGLAARMRAEEMYDLPVMVAGMEGVYRQAVSA